MSLSYYRVGMTCIAIETGMPEQATKAGWGETPREARESLDATPLQSVGRDGGEAATLRWALRQDGVDTDTSDEPELIKVGRADLDDRMTAWAD